MSTKGIIENAAAKADGDITEAEDKIMSDQTTPFVQRKPWTSVIVASLLSAVLSFGSQSPYITDHLPEIAISSEGGRLFTGKAVAAFIHSYCYGTPEFRGGLQKAVNDAYAERYPGEKYHLQLCSKGD